MGRYSAIEWCHHTFNPWWGCVEISPACDHCYARAWAGRWNYEWGKETPRRFFPDRHWNDPVRWNKAAAAAGERHRVFCSSMADVFEDRRDLDVHRERLWRLIDDTPNLNWLLLTKRPNKVRKIAPWGNDWPFNVWLGTTIEEQRFVAKVHFVSAEPLLGPVDFTDYLDRIGWMIVGGETGHGARPMHKEWAEAILDQCERAGVPFHFKQWGDHNDQLIRIGKKAAGRMLRGTTHDGLPLEIPMPL